MDELIVECFDNENGGLSITIGNKYQIEDEDISGYRITNDKNIKQWYMKSRFKPLKKDSLYEHKEVINIIKDGDTYKNIYSEYLVQEIKQVEGQIRYKVAKNSNTTIGVGGLFKKVDESRLITFEEARKEYRDNKKTIKSCVSERIFKNGIDTEIGFSEIEGQWIVID